MTRRTLLLCAALGACTPSSPYTEGTLDKSCPGGLQGENRLVRHENYRAYRELFPAWTGSVFEVVPGVGHDGARMLLSDAARRAAFR